MNVYVIYKFDNNDQVEATLSNIYKKIEEGSNNTNIYFFRFEKGVYGRRWKKYARKKMKEANLILFFDSIVDGNEKEQRIRNIQWELKYAKKIKKKIVIVSSDKPKYSHKIYASDYSEKAIDLFRYKVFTKDNIADYLISEANWSMDKNLVTPIKRFEQNGKNISEDNYYQLLLSQYRIMVETSEKLMERRLTTTNLYITICSMILAFSSASLVFQNIILSCIIFIMCGIIICAVCYNWMKLLGSYDLNNAGKFAVLNAIEKNLPADMFDSEYRYNTSNGIKSFSAREKRLPVIFLTAGSVLVLIGISLLIASLGFGYFLPQDNQPSESLSAMIKYGKMVL